MIKHLIGGTLALAMTAGVAAAAPTIQAHVLETGRHTARTMDDFQALESSRDTAHPFDARTAGVSDPNDYRLGYFRNF